jgi:DNA-nicking Smr family endonuclease
MKTGDNVRFLNAVGGGRISRIDEKKGLVFVEDEDGFEIPTLAHDCVVVGAVNVETNILKKDFFKKEDEKNNTATQAQVANWRQQENDRVEFEEPIIETENGDALAALLAFIPQDIKKLQTTNYDCILVNDSNYFLFYNIIIGENYERYSAANGILEPNTQENIAIIQKDELNIWAKIGIQIIAFKRGKTYAPPKAIDAIIPLNPVKFYKLHSFIENDYFEENALLLNLVNIAENQEFEKIAPEEIKNAIQQKTENKPRLVLKKTAQKRNEIIEIDLHINELLDTTSGMNNADMLNYQLDTFHKTLAENARNKGQKIVFIHGKGDGVLRKEIENQLKTRYKTFYFQDASFREYGFGATMVTIR